jgi:hypothetical protein
MTRRTWTSRFRGAGRDRPGSGDEKAAKEAIAAEVTAAAEAEVEVE